MKFGSSHTVVDSFGRPIKVLVHTEEVCPVCKDKPAGASTYVVTSKSPAYWLLECPDCGDSRSALESDVKVARPRPRNEEDTTDT